MFNFEGFYDSIGGTRNQEGRNREGARESKEERKVSDTRATFCSIARTGTGRVEEIVKGFRQIVRRTRSGRKTYYGSLTVEEKKREVAFIEEEVEGVGRRGADSGKGLCTRGARGVPYSVSRAGKRGGPTGLLADLGLTRGD